MSLVIEDGSGVEGALSYISTTYFREWAEARGYTIPEVDGLLLGPIVEAGEFLNNLDYNGEKLKENQGMAFPRGEEGIPQELKLAQARLAYDALQGAALFVNFPARNEESITVGPISIDYAKPVSEVERFPAVMSLLRHYRKATNNSVTRA